MGKGILIGLGAFWAGGFLKKSEKKMLKLMFLLDSLGLT